MHSLQSNDTPNESSRLLLAKLWRQIAPTLAENSGRVALALGCLLLAKGGLLLIPFLLKGLVDSLNQTPVPAPAALILLMVVAYGTARFANTLFAELGIPCSAG